MRRLEVTSVFVYAEDGGPERVHAISGPTVDGSRWLVWDSEAIEGMENGRWAFYVRDEQGASHPLVVASDGRTRFLKTDLDGAEPTSLLRLPRCPVANFVFLRAHEVVASRY